MKTETSKESESVETIKEMFMNLSPEDRRLFLEKQCTPKMIKHYEDLVSSDYDHEI